jgi:hypothetical protein
MLGWETVVSILSGYGGLVTGLVFLYVRSLRSSYDARVSDLKEHQAETLAVIREQQKLDRLRADSMDKVLATTQTVEALLKALPVGSGTS